MDRSLKTLGFWVVIVISATLLWQVVRGAKSAQTPEIMYSTFVSKAQSGEVARVTVAGTQIQGEYRNGAGAFHLTGPSNPTAFLEILQNKGVEIQFRDANEGSLLLQLLGTWAPLILLAALWFLMIRQIRRRNPPSGPGQSLGPSGGLG